MKDKHIKMSKYQNGKIYKITIGDDIYVGNTTKKHLSQRKASHVYQSKVSPNINLYKCVLENGGWENAKFEIIEVYPCDSKKDLEIRERFWVENLKSTLNSCIPSRGKEEYREVNKLKMQDYLKLYYEKNKEDLKIKQKQYNEENQNKIKEQRKQFRENNKEIIALQKKEHYEKNKAYYLEKQAKYRLENLELITQKEKTKRDARKLQGTLSMT